MWKILRHIFNSIGLALSDCWQVRTGPFSCYPLFNVSLFTFCADPFIKRYLNKSGFGFVRNIRNGTILLKVLSHQIRLAWRWYGWIGLDEYKNRGWVKWILNVVSISKFWFNLSERYITNHDLLCMQFADSNAESPKGNCYPFATAHKDISVPPFCKLQEVTGIR